MEKEYNFEVKIVSACSITAEREEEAREILKKSWEAENDIELTDDEIRLVNN